MKALDGRPLGGVRACVPEPHRRHAHQLWCRAGSVELVEGIGSRGEYVRLRAQPWIVILFSTWWTWGDDQAATSAWFFSAQDETEPVRTTRSP